MLFFTGCTCRKAKSSRRTLREKSLSAVGDACKRQSTTELCGTSGFDSSGSFSIVLNYGPHSPTVFRQILTSSSLSKTTCMVRKITFCLFKKLCVYHSWLQKEDVISYELLHWFIQKSRFLLLQRLLLTVFSFICTQWFLVFRLVMQRSSPTSLNAHHATLFFVGRSVAWRACCKGD